MNLAQILLPAILLVTLLLQAILPRVRLVVVLSGAIVSVVAATLLGVSTLHEILKTVPWDVLVILASLTYLSELMVESRLFGLLALGATRLAGARPLRLIVVFAVVMFLISGLVNNITALVLVIPVFLIVLKLTGVSQRFANWALGVLLVSCNLGGASTPIGDFPAILLLGSGVMTFSEYLREAWPPACLGVLALLAVVTFLVRPDRGMDDSPMASRLSIAVMGRLYRNVTLDRRRLAIPSVCLVGMILAWSLVPPATGISPDVISWVGVGIALLFRGVGGESIVRSRFESASVLFLFALFVMVGAVRQTGVFGRAAQWILELGVGRTGQLVVFLVMAGVLTGLFSAGPAMAALLDVASRLAERLPPDAVYVGLALSVCAGSSLFLTAATSGPLAQALTEKAELRDPDGQVVTFDFFGFMPVGLLSFALIQSLAVAYGIWKSYGV